MLKKLAQKKNKYHEWYIEMPKEIAIEASYVEVWHDGQELCVMDEDDSTIHAVPFRVADDHESPRINTIDFNTNEYNGENYEGPNFELVRLYDEESK